VDPVTDFQADYQPGEQVKLLPLDLPATVALVRFAEGGAVDYFVTWWADGKRCQEWLYASEIAKS
jgi:hypothetical protein